MEHAAAGRSIRAAATLTTVGALALTPLAVAPPQLHAPDISAARISTEAVQLTDAWSDLFTGTLGSVVQLGAIFVGADSNFPLPNPIFIAPIAAQLVINPLIYAVQLFTGQSAKIPTEIADHFANIAALAQNLASDLPAIIVAQIQTPFLAAQLTIDYFANATNKLIALLEAPAVFLDTALNSQYGLIGVNGPLAVPIIVRNLLASGLGTPLPTITLPFKKPAAAASTPKPTAATVAGTAPSGTASSARSKPKSPASANSKRKAESAKASDKPAGVGHGKRN